MQCVHFLCIHLCVHSMTLYAYICVYTSAYICVYTAYVCIHYLHTVHLCTHTWSAYNGGGQRVDSVDLVTQWPCVVALYMYVWPWVTLEIGVLYTHDTCAFAEQEFSMCSFSHFSWSSLKRLPLVLYAFWLSVFLFQSHFVSSRLEKQKNVSHFCFLIRSMPQ